MSADTRWHSVVANLHHTLGILYYSYEWLAIAAGGGFAVSAASLLAGHRNSAVLALLLLSLAGLAIAAYFWLRGSVRRHQARNPSLKLLTLEETLIIPPEGDVQYKIERTIRARVLHDGTDHYEAGFNWTGTPRDGLACEVRSPPGWHASLVAEPHSSGHVCRIYFDRPRRRGDEITFTYGLTLPDYAHTFRPFLALMVNDWISEHLTLRVIFRRRPVPKHYKRQILLSSASQLPVHEEEQSTRPQGDATEAYWRVRKPRPSYRYRVIWF